VLLYIAQSKYLCPFFKRGRISHVAIDCHVHPLDDGTLEAMAIPATVLGAAERKSAAQKFTLENHGLACGHLFTDNKAFVNGKGTCKLHKNKQCTVDSRKPHMASGGLPCQSLTRMRWTGGGAKGTGPVHTHPDYESFASGWFEYLEVRQPQQWFVEEVMDIKRLDARDGKTHLAKFCSGAAKRGYSVRAFDTDHGDYIEGCRKRVIVVGFSEAAGGKVAADWFTKEFQEPTTSVVASTGICVCVSM
jgi:hypothetical protein